MSQLFKEAIEKLGDEVKILSAEETDKIFYLFERSIPIYRGGSRIDWSKIDNKMPIYSLDNLIPELEQLLHQSLDHSVYIFWNDALLPVIRTNLTSALMYFEDVIAVGFETWFFNPEQGYVIEYYYLNEMNIGLVKPYDQIVDVIDAEYIHQVRLFLEKLDLLPARDAVEQLLSIEKEINTLLGKIKLCDQAYEAQTYFGLLVSFKDILKKYHYKMGIQLPPYLQEFIKRFARIDSQELREKIFDQLQSGNLNKL